MALGWVYILSNEAMPGLIKIGQSAADPALRASELHTTAVPSPFFVEYKGLFENFAALERQIHAELSEHRHEKNREFFRISPPEALEAIRRVANGGAKYEEAAAATLWRGSGQGYCRVCGVVVSQSSRMCGRCGAPNPTD